MMNVYAPITHENDGNMTSKGQVLIPKALRDRAGLQAGGEVTIGMNDQGDVVVRPRRAAEGPEARRLRIRAALEKLRGRIDTGFATTDEYMDFIRPHRRDA